MGEQAVAVGVVDIGTNSMRLLVTDGVAEQARLVQVTGLGRGVDSTGQLSALAMERTLGVLETYGDIMSEHEVGPRRAIATSASRDAANREQFFDRAETALGVRPVLITGSEEARLAYAGATSDIEDTDGVLVSDIGGGSTEFVTEQGAASVDIGSVRLTERVLSDRPAPPIQLQAAHDLVEDRFSRLEIPGLRLIGVAGTWTSLSAMILDLPRYDRARVHGSRIKRADLAALVETLSRLTIEETEMIPALDPDRAPVILAGAVVAEGVMRCAGADVATVSEKDSLDAVAAELLALL